MPAPNPVAVPPARPTLPGGTHVPSGSQVVGQPAVAKAPQFELDEAGGGLLSKRKLHELVRQIDPEETLAPEVEEVCAFPQYKRPKYLRMCIYWMANTCYNRGFLLF